jgi:hypothetical protein
MKERPILFNDPMVRAILQGRKTQTRRILRPQPRLNWVYKLTPEFKAVQVSTQYDTMGVHDGVFIKCPYGRPGDRLWVREAFCETDWKPGTSGFPADPATGFIIAYRADYPDWPTRPFPAPWDANWKPSIFMPRWASRLTLEITGVRVERVQEISEEDAKAEGCSKERIGAEAGALEGMHFTARKQFAEFWDSINARRGFGWAINPWVWVIKFKRIVESVA